jgi:hypothetical protein
MKKNLYLFLLITGSFTTFVTAQSTLSHTTTPIDSRLLEIYSGDYLENLQTANPFLLKRWGFYLDNSWYLTELPAEKVMDSYATIRVDDFERDWEKQTVLKIENTDRALVLYSGKRFNEMLNAHLAKEKQ